MGLYAQPSESQRAAILHSEDLGQTLHRADKATLMASAADQHHRARLLAVTAADAGDWLFALPISGCGLRLDDESIRVAVGLRLGVNLCQPHTWSSLQNEFWTHGSPPLHQRSGLARTPSCRYSINQEPVGLSR